jgi:hypothetical protein
MIKLADIDLANAVANNAHGCSWTPVVWGVG